MAIKKSQLFNSIWAACDGLRGGMDASQYKDYVLVLLFVRYVSDKYSGKKSADVDIPPGGSFADMVALKGKKEIGEGKNKVLKTLARANGLEGVIDEVDFDNPDKLGSGKEMVDRLSKLVAIFENPDLDFSKNRAEGDDLLGDAYEFLMKHFAVESGKSKGQFYTPAEVSRVIAKVIDVKSASRTTQSVYDPTCGSGSLLLKVAAEAPVKITIFGQEKDNQTGSLARMNMWLHGETTHDIRKGKSTLAAPWLDEKGSLKLFDYVVANPPFSSKNWKDGFDPDHDIYGRFENGIPPTKNGDYAFLLHILSSLKSTGTGAVILPHGVLFRGNGESSIRTNLVKRGYIKAIIGLPANLFYGTSIPACIIVLDKKDSSSRKGIFMVDASKGFVKDGNKNRLQERDIKKIIDTFEGQSEVTKYSRFVTNEEIKDNEYNLNISRYIDTQEPEDVQNIEAHLKGGIPTDDVDAFSDYWSVCPTLRKAIFKPSSRKEYSELVLMPEQVRSIIFEHKEFASFRSSVLKKFNAWHDEVSVRLKKIDTNDHPKAIIGPIATLLLNDFDSTRLVDKYNIYQHLMTYWAETMQDDVYIITVDGWKAGNGCIRLKKGTKDIKGMEGLEGRLIPTGLIIDNYFAEQKSSLDDLNAKLEQLIADVEELKDEYGGEDGLLSEVIEEESINKSSVTRRVKEIKDDKDSADELEVLKKLTSLFDREAEIKKDIKELRQDLENKVFTKYPKLTLEEIKDLVIEKKWMSSIESAIQTELDQLSQTLAGRIRELAERYETPLPVLVKEVDLLSRKVDAHIKKMGFV